LVQFLVESEVKGKMRKGSMLEGLFLDVASPEDREVINRLYEKRNYGAAEQVAVRKIRDIWPELISNSRFAYH